MSVGVLGREGPDRVAGESQVTRPWTTQVRDLRVPVQAACITQLAHEETHGRSAVQLHLRALREALREAGQRQVPHAQKPPGPQAYLTCLLPRTSASIYLYSWTSCPDLSEPKTATGAAPTAGGRRCSPFPLGRCPALSLHVPPMELAPGTTLPNCVKNTE